MNNKSRNGNLQGIAYRTAPRTPMITVEAGQISLETGVENDSRGKPSKRQVTVLSTEAWHNACNEIDKQLPWTTRRANLLVEGFTFSEADVGKQIRIGDVILEITRETDPCNRMDQQAPGLRKALESDWRGGVCTRVVQGGTIAVGNEVELI